MVGRRKKPGRKSRSADLRFILTITICTAMVAFALWRIVQIPLNTKRVGYQIRDAEEIIKDLKEQCHELVAQWQTITAYDRIESQAKELGLNKRSNEQVVRIVYQGGNNEAAVLRNFRKRYCDE